LRNTIINHGTKKRVETWRAASQNDESDNEILKAFSEALFSNETSPSPETEIVRTTGIAVNTLLSRKHYAVLHLRKRMRQLYEDIIIAD